MPAPAVIRGNPAQFPVLMRPQQYQPDPLTRIAPLFDGGGRGGEDVAMLSALLAYMAQDEQGRMQRQTTMDLATLNREEQTRQFDLLRDQLTNSETRWREESAEQRRQFDSILAQQNARDARTEKTEAVDRLGQLMMLQLQRDMATDQRVERGRTQASDYLASTIEEDKQQIATDLTTGAASDALKEARTQAKAVSSIEPGMRQALDTMGKLGKLDFTNYGRDPQTSAQLVDRVMKFANDARATVFKKNSKGELAIDNAAADAVLPELVAMREQMAAVPAKSNNWTSFAGIGRDISGLPSPEEEMKSRVVSDLDAAIDTIKRHAVVPGRTIEQSMEREAKATGKIRDITAKTTASRDAVWDAIAAGESGTELVGVAKRAYSGQPVSAPRNVVSSQPADDPVLDFGTLTPEQRRKLEEEAMREALMQAGVFQ